MSNLSSARQAIKAELVHAQQGMAFYQARMEALEDALSKLESVETTETAKRPSKKSEAARGAAKPRRRRQAGKSRASGGAELPATGRDFWMSLITDQPQSAREIQTAAIAALGISPSQEQLKKLAQRQTNALHNLVHSKAIGDSGSGRERRFFRSH